MNINLNLKIIQSRSIHLFLMGMSWLFWTWMAQPTCSTHVFQRFFRILRPLLIFLFLLGDSCNFHSLTRNRLLHIHGFICFVCLSENTTLFSFLCLHFCPFPLVSLSYYFIILVKISTLGSLLCMVEAAIRVLIINGSKG